MGTFKKLPKEVQQHLLALSGISELTTTPSLKDLLADAWLKKEKIFMDQVHAYRMKIESHISRNEKRAFLILTYSGSILGAGPVENGDSRQVIYASIGIRKDVPEKLVEEKLKLKSDIFLDSESEFTGGSLKRTSPAYKIALMPDQIHPADQVRQIEEATKVMTQEFVTINNTLIPE